jgi:hypothetical protein
MSLGLLFRQDPAFRTLRVSAPIALLVGAMVRGVAGEMPAGFGTRPVAAEAGLVGFLFGTLWLCTPFLLAPGHFWMRSSRLGLTLPVTARRLWLVRILSLAVSLVVPVALFVLPLALRTNGGDLRLDLGVLGLVPGTTAALVLMLLLYHVPSPRLFRMRGWEYVAWVAAISIVVMMITLALPPSWWVVAPLVAGVLGLGVVLVRALPRVFVVSPHDPEDPWEPPPTVIGAADVSMAGATLRSAPEDRSGEARGPLTPATGTAGAASAKPLAFARLLHITIARTLDNHLLGWVNLVLIFFYSAVLAGDFAGGRTPLPRLVLAYIWVQAFFAQALARLNKLDAWPVSRRILFAHAMLPALLVLAIGLGVGAAVTAIRVPPSAQVRYEDGQVQVPVEFDEIAPDGRPPTITAPWGESYTPRAYRVLQGRAAAVYNPFEHGENSSDRFIAWQLDRAVAAVHGGPPPQSGHDAYTNLAPELVQGIEAGTFAVVASQGRPSDARWRALALSLVGLVALTTLVMTIALQQHRPGRHPGVYRWTAVAFIGLGVAAVLGTVLAERSAFTDAAWALGAVALIRLRELAGTIAMSTSGLWLTALASIAAGYMIVQERFVRLEAPTKPVPSELLRDY